MISQVNTIVLNGLEVIPARVEVGFSRGIPGTAIVGLPDNAVRESRERLRLAIKNSGFQYPHSTKIVINLSPADVRKEGAAFDLPIAVAVLANEYQLESPRLKDYLFYGELNLKGCLNPVKGILNLALFARKKGFKGIVIPRKNGIEASYVRGIDVFALRDLKEVMALVNHSGEFKPLPWRKLKAKHRNHNDFANIRGQFLAKRMLEIAAAGFHNALLIGPPGSGKSMLSKSMPSILPDMTEEEILETSLIYSAAGFLERSAGLITERPFRSPHHTISDVGISGGGKVPVPGEISLAHNGVLFLDELPYFKKSALEVLRQPMEDGCITVSRSLTSLTFPSRFMLITAMNPCEDSIGWKDRGMECTDYQKRKYYSKISGPLLDRIDLQIEVKRVPISDITASAAAEGSQNIRARITRARHMQLERFLPLSSKKIFANGQMGNPEISRFCALDAESKEILARATEKFSLSARSYFKVLKVSRTIADLEQEEKILPAHIQEALQYRTLDLSQF